MLDACGKPLMPCTPRRARRLIEARRVAKRFYRPFTIQLKDRSVDDGNSALQAVEVRTTPGARHTEIRVVALLENEERTLYREEVPHHGRKGRARVKAAEKRIAGRVGQRSAGTSRSSPVRRKAPEREEQEAD